MERANSGLGGRPGCGLAGYNLIENFVTNSDVLSFRHLSGFAITCPCASLQVKLAVICFYTATIEYASRNVRHIIAKGNFFQCCCF